MWDESLIAAGTTVSQDHFGTRALSSEHSHFLFKNRSFLYNFMKAHDRNPDIKMSGQ